MEGINKYLYKYGLHDCIVDNIYLEDNKLCFYFNSGIYELDLNGKEITKTSSCKMLIEINDWDFQNLYEHIEIYKINKNKIKEVDINYFIKELINYKFDINLNYFSNFSNSILIEGYINTYLYQIKISEINKIDFDFLNIF